MPWTSVSVTELLRLVPHELRESLESAFAATSLHAAPVPNPQANLLLEALVAVEPAARSWLQLL